MHDTYSRSCHTHTLLLKALMKTSAYELYFMAYPLSFFTRCINQTPGRWVMVDMCALCAASTRSCLGRYGIVNCRKAETGWASSQHYTHSEEESNSQKEENEYLFCCNIQILPLFYIHTAHRIGRFSYLCMEHQLMIKDIHTTVVKDIV